MVEIRKVHAPAFNITILLSCLCIFYDLTISVAFGIIVEQLRLSDTVARGFARITLHGMNRSSHIPIRVSLFPSDIDIARHLKPSMRTVPSLDTIHGSDTSSLSLIEEAQHTLSQSLRTHIILPLQSLTHTASTQLDSTSTSPSPLPSLSPRERRREAEERLEMALHDMDDMIIVYDLIGKLTYVNVERHTDRLRKLTQYKRPVVILLDTVLYIDLDGVQTLTQMISEYEKLKIPLILAGVQSECESILYKTPWFEKLKSSDIVVPTMEIGVEQARIIAQRITKEIV